MDVLVHDRLGNVYKRYHCFLLIVFDVVFLFDLDEYLLLLRFKSHLIIINCIIILLFNIDQFKTVLVKVLSFKVYNIIQTIVFVTFKVVQVKSAILGPIPTRSILDLLLLLFFGHESLENFLIQDGFLRLEKSYPVIICEIRYLLVLSPTKYIVDAFLKFASPRLIFLYIFVKVDQLPGITDLPYFLDELWIEVIAKELLELVVESTNLVILSNNHSFIKLIENSLEFILL